MNGNEMVGHETLPKKDGPFPSGPPKCGDEVSITEPRMPFVPIKPMPEGFWRSANPTLQALRSGNGAKPPRNVLNYRIQEIPDGCHNCNNQYCGMSNGIACGLACRTPDKPSFCDLVSPLGICDSYDKYIEKVKPTA